MSAAAEEAVELETALQKKYLAETLEVLQTLSPEGRFNFGREGLRVALVDPANVAMHYLDLGTGAFEDVPGGQVTLGIALDRLADAIDKAGQSDVVTLGYIPAKGMLNVSYGNVDVNMAAIDPDSVRDSPDESDLTHANEFTVERETLADALDITEMVADHVRIECLPDDREVRFIGQGDTDDATYTIDREEVIDGKINDETLSMFSMDYLWGRGTDAAGIVRSMPDGEVTLRVAHEEGDGSGDPMSQGEYPLDMEYQYADGHGEVLTRLAPRIQSQ